MKRYISTSFKVLIILFLIGIMLFSGIMLYSLTVSRVPLDISKITDTSLEIAVFGEEGLKLDEFNAFNCPRATLDKIPPHVVNAFISIEDKKFFSHKGINVPRMFKAFINNIKSMSLKEGASTITQQLIKNTHLSFEKNLPRKFNEIVLSLNLERQMSKENILENYLNVIYFGSGAYGIESASQHYFSKPVQQLSIAEGALLAGIIKSPNKYSPISRPQKAKERRNMVLFEMKKDGLISAKEFHDLAQTDLNLSLSTSKKNKLNSYSQSAIDEATELLNMTERQLAISGYKIYTYQDLDKQMKLNSLLSKTKIDSDYAVINIDSKSGGVLAYNGESSYKILKHPRQIGSLAKPILVYGPAINENIISPASLILDEPLTIDSYSPQNVSGTYQGYVSARQALSKSLNIPAVKTASYVGLEKISSYANKMDLPLSSKDYSYSLALGGLTYGFSVKDTFGAYTAFANAGEFSKPRFVKYITNANGDIVYKNPETKQKVFREDSAYLVTDILKTCAKSGTARKLGDLNFDVAAKTGTVGNVKGNLDAYSVAYTTEDIVGVWMGNMDNKYIKTAGGNQPTALAKEYLKKIYATTPPTNFEMPSSVEKVAINQFELDTNHKLVRANSLTSPLDTTYELFSRFNLPKTVDYSYFLVPPNLVGYVENQTAILKFTAKANCSYKLYKKTGSQTTLVKTISSQAGTQEIFDPLVLKQKTEYFLEEENPSTKTTQKSDSVILINNQSTPKPKWYI